MSWGDFTINSAHAVLLHDAYFRPFIANPYQKLMTRLDFSYPKTETR